MKTVLACLAMVGLSGCVAPDWMSGGLQHPTQSQQALTPGPQPEAVRQEAMRYARAERISEGVQNAYRGWLVCVNKRQEAQALNPDITWKCKDPDYNAIENEP